MIRYNVTYKNKDGNRQLFGPNQARHFFDDRGQAESYLAVMLRNNSESLLALVCGEQAIGTFRVDEFDCWDNGDAKHSIFLQAAEPEPVTVSAGKEDARCEEKPVAAGEEVIATYPTRASWNASMLRKPDGDMPYFKPLNIAYGWKEGQAPLDVLASPEHETAAKKAGRGTEVPLWAYLHKDGSWTFETRKQEVLVHCGSMAGKAGAKNKPRRKAKSRE
jgi:hypothetical protein